MSSHLANVSDTLLNHMLRRCCGPALESADEEALRRGWPLPPNPWRKETR